jgi:V8-like Glu-specific endopeptidase
MFFNVEPATGVARDGWLDVGLIVVELQTVREGLNKMPLRRNQDTVSGNTCLAVVGYPDGGEQTIALGAPVVSLQPNLLNHTANTEYGSSGKLVMSSRLHSIEKRL